MNITPQDVERLSEKAIANKSLGIEHLDYLFSLSYDICHYYRLAYYLVNEFKPNVVLEIGTQYSRCCANFAGGNPDTKVFTIDVAECYDKDIAPRYPNLNYIRSNSCDPDTINKFDDHSIDICFVDAFHATSQVLNEVKLWAPKIKEGGLWLFDDLWMMDDLFEKIPFKVKGTLPGVHMCPNGNPPIIKDVLMAYAIND